MAESPSPPNTRFLHEEPRVLSAPHVITRVTDPKERDTHDRKALHAWVQGHFRRHRNEIRENTRRAPQIPAGAAVGDVPT